MCGVSSARRGGLRQISAKVVVVWDNYSARRSKPVRDLCVAEPERLSVELLPGYAPEFNASESIWKYLKVEKLGNRIHEVVEEVFVSVSRVLESLRYKHGLLKSFFRRAGWEALVDCS